MPPNGTKPALRALVTSEMTRMPTASYRSWMELLSLPTYHFLVFAGDVRLYLCALDYSLCLKI
jgi:hypothetical protein